MEPSPPPRDATATAAIDLAALVGLAGVAAGLILLAPSDLGFDPSGAIAALAAWIPVTLPIAVIILAATALDVGTGVVLARAIRGRPFERMEEALLQGFVLAVVKDVALLSALAGFGLFGQAVLAAAHVAILAVAWLRFRPVLAPGAVPRLGAATPLGALVVVAWAAPILLQLASPVVPFLDVLPNHVAPAEHLRTFGTLTELTDTQSPIYGPSRIFLGYSALLGTITTLSGLPAGEALAGFILPSTILVALGVGRLATALGGPGATIWALLTFALTTSLARLGDARATVVVLPLVAWALADLADRLGSGQDRGPAPPDRAAAARGSPIRERSAALVPGLALGAAILVHPVIGFLAVLTVAIVVLVRPATGAALGIPAIGIAAVAGLPQAATMLGIGLPPIVLILALAGGVGLGLALERAPGVGLALVRVGRVGAAVAAIAAITFAGPLVRSEVAGATPLLSVVELSFVAALAGLVLGAPGGRSVVAWAALAAGFAVAGLTQLVPEEGSGLLGQALRFELPKTLQYWVPVFVALLAAFGLRGILGAERLPEVARGVAVVAFVGSAALPLRTTPIDAFHLGEHRISETLSIALRWAERGFWAGFPDSRYIVDAPRRALIDAVRVEVRAGRLGPDTPVLHVAQSFQQWVATPLGVFTGVTETDVVADAVVSIHTVGGRLRPFDDLDALLRGGAYPYLLLEPAGDDVPPDIRDRIIGAGYVPRFANEQGELFRLGAP